MAKSEFKETRAVARLPHLDIEMVHRRPWEGEGEALTISLTASPSLEAVERLLETANPVLFWSRFMQAAWTPWLGALAMTSAAMRALSQVRKT